MAMTPDEAATAHAEAVARLRTAANATYATPRDRADAIESAKMAADEASTALTLARIAAKRRGPDSLEARVYRAAVAAFGHVLLRRGRSWDAIVGPTLDTLAATLGVTPGGTT